MKLLLKWKRKVAVIDLQQIQHAWPLVTKEAFLWYRIKNIKCNRSQFRFYFFLRIVRYEVPMTSFYFLFHSRNNLSGSKTKRCTVLHTFSLLSPLILLTPLFQLTLLCSDIIFFSLFTSVLFGIHIGQKQFKESLFTVYVQIMEINKSTTWLCFRLRLDSAINISTRETQEIKCNKSMYLLTAHAASKYL